MEQVMMLVVVMVEGEQVVVMVEGEQVVDGPGVQFLGGRQLLEYTLISETFTNYTLNQVSHIKIEFSFRNQYGYYIGNTFLPSIMLVIICWATLHFDIADFQDRIMVSLTSLLVLATFFTQTSQSIPKTAYLKLIDVWFVALISEDFTIIISLVYIEVLRLRHPATNIKVAPVGSLMGGASSNSSPVQVNCNKKALRMNRILFNLFSLTMVIMVLSFGCMCVFSLLSH
ncbi:ligand-gated ion channel 46-like 2 [Homarus americanus]|uniref:Ligand-gated ion channel 46-like 2 n=1 Tax=Homarus americanus TaxID=6706 RepID=A0A8J5MTH7_HOMAM|nr:ligand-gated ion channel 46-like 2 [Homarus americanus]